MHAGKKTLSIPDYTVWAFAACAVFFVVALVGALDQPLTPAGTALTAPSQLNSAPKNFTSAPLTLIDSRLIEVTAKKLAPSIPTAKQIFYSNNA